MSRRQREPGNIFYRKADPNPPVFDEPNEGDIYFNTISRTLRIFTDGSWVDVIGGGGGTSDHGMLSGLDDDDHLQYFTESRGDDRYLLRDVGGSSGIETLNGNFEVLHHLYAKYGEFEMGVDASDNYVTRVADPIADTDAANKRYVDSFGGSGSVTYSASPPSNPSDGDVWIERTV